MCTETRKHAITDFIIHEKETPGIAAKVGFLYLGSDTVGGVPQTDPLDLDFSSELPETAHGSFRNHDFLERPVERVFNIVEESMSNQHPYNGHKRILGFRSEIKESRR